MVAASVILIAVNQQDIASTNQADALRRMVDWTIMDALRAIQPMHITT